jgi:hypothetical protein
LGSLDLGGAENYLALDESIAQPTARWFFSYSGL